MHRKKRTEKDREENNWRRKMFGLRRSKRTEKEKEGKWEMKNYCSRDGWNSKDLEEVLADLKT